MLTSVPENKTALIAMSGGVDSSVAACLMLSRGYVCEGAAMRLFRSRDIGRDAARPCCSRADLEDAAAVAARLGIPFSVPDFTREFRDRVIRKFVQTYAQGGTPNPCIDCNRYMKFDELLCYAQERGLRYLATGHYARIAWEEARGRYTLKKALDPEKDQSYVLYMLTQAQLARLRFPLGDLRKAEVRAIAREQGFPNAEKRDSQDICFVPDGDCGGFLERRAGALCRPGDLLDPEGNVIGRHRGALRYTLGQRRGLGLAAGERLYVLGKDMERNTVTLGPEAALYCRILLAEEANWLSIPPPEGPLPVMARVRYRQREAPAVVYPLGEDRFRLEFERPQRAPAPGQAVVLYDGDVVLGGGTIRAAGNT